MILASVRIIRTYEYCIFIGGTYVRTYVRMTLLLSLEASLLEPHVRTHDLSFVRNLSSIAAPAF